MKVTLEGVSFRDAVRTVAALFDAEAYALLTASAESGMLIVEAGKNGVYCRQNLEANVEEEGQIVISIAHFLRMDFQDPLHMEVEKSSISFKSGKMKGVVVASGDAENIEAQRPVKSFKASVNLPTDILRGALSRIQLGSALPGTQLAIRIQASESLTLSTTDQYRAVVFKEKLVVAQKEFDILMQPSFLSAALSRIQDGETSIGAHNGTFRIKTESLDVFHPAIQSTPEDVEEWINNGIDYDSKGCSIKTSVEELMQSLREVSAIHMGAIAYDTHIDCLIKGTKAHFRCVAEHGSTQTSLSLEESTADKFATKLSSKYMMEMLNLIKAGDIEIDFWDTFLLIKGMSGKFKGLLPTVAS